MPKRTYKRLTAATVKAASRQPGAVVADGDGLRLEVSSAGVASWVFRYRAGGRERYMGLGPLRHVTLTEARKLADDARRLRRAGLDPIEQRREQRLEQAVATARAIDFRKCAEMYIVAHRAGWKNAVHATQWAVTLETYAFPVFGALPVQTIDVALVMKAIEPIWTVKPETASRVRGRIESVLDWATARGCRQGENPARWKGHLENLLPKKSAVRRVVHHAAIPLGEVGAFLIELRQRREVAARALEFAILTAARSSEAIGARWGEVSLHDRVWTVPGQRMKGGRGHRVPLSDAALALVERMAATRSGDLVFPGVKDGQPMARSALLNLLHRMGRGDLTVHGFRSAFTDWAADRTAFPREVREQALAHAIGNQVEAAYRRGDLFEKRRQLMAAWAGFCARPDVDGAEVVALAAIR